MLICVGIPCMDGKPYAALVDSLLAETVLGFGQGVYILPIWEIGCSLIGVARNRIADKFLKTKADCLVFVDSDISWKGGDLIRLAKRQERVVGTTYRAKRDDEYWHVRGNPERAGDLWKVEGLPGGFIKVDRSVFDDLPADPYLDENSKPMRDFFPCGFRDGMIWGEDYGFCQLVLKAGESIYLDPSIKLKHHDGLRAYSGDLSAWMDAQWPMQT